MVETKGKRTQGEIYQTALASLSPKQVLVPKLSGGDIIGWKLRNIRRLRINEIEALMDRVPGQLDEAKRTKIIAREERLRGMRG